MKVISAVLLALAVAACCEAAKIKLESPEDNIFGEQTVRIITLDKLKRRLGNASPNVTEVARLLFWSKHKDQFVMKKVTIGKLVRLAELYPKKPEGNCFRSLFEEFEAVRKKVSLNVYLDKYCQHCIDVQFERCAQIDAETLYTFLVQSMPYGSDLLHHSHAVTKFIRDKNRAGESEAKNVADYLQTISEDERTKYRTGCDQLEKMISRDLFYFDKDGSKRAELAEKVDKDKNWLRGRCEFVKNLVAAKY